MATDAPSRDPAVFDRPGSASIRPAAITDAVYELALRVGSMEEAGLSPEDVQALIDAALAAHEGEADPHSIYLTQSEADPLYLTQSEADALYLPASYTPPPFDPTAYDARWVNQDGDTVTGALMARLATNPAPAFETYQGAQSFPKLSIQAGGSVVWGAGTGAGDATVFRSAASVLAVSAHWVPGNASRTLGQSANRWNTLWASTVDAATAITLAGSPVETQANKGQPSGYVPLDAGGLIPTVHLPPLAITNTYVVASEAAMLALVAQTGDVAVRTDTGATFILAAEPASVLGNWVGLSTGEAGVTSVNGETGAVILSAADVGAVAKTGDTMSGALQVNIPGGASYGLRIHGGTSQVIWLGGNGTERVIRFSNAALENRWILGVQYAGEAGSNSGSDFSLMRYSDANALLGAALSISRATGAATFGGAVSATTLTTTVAGSDLYRPIVRNDIRFAPVPTGGADLNLGRTGNYTLEMGYPGVPAGVIRFTLANNARIDAPGGPLALSGTGTGVTITPTLTVAGKAVAISPDANNTIVWNANGFYAAAGAIPPEYVTDAELNTALARYVAKAGDTMQGALTTQDLVVSGPSFHVGGGRADFVYGPGAVGFTGYLHAATGGYRRWVGAGPGGNPRWGIELGDTVAETGSNAGSNFVVARYGDDGTLLGGALTITRATGNATFGGDVRVPYPQALYTAFVGHDAGNLFLSASSGWIMPGLLDPPQKLGNPDSAWAGVYTDLVGSRTAGGLTLASEANIAFTTTTGGFVYPNTPTASLGHISYPWQALYVQGVNIAGQDIDARFVGVAGDTMTGPLVLEGASAYFMINGGYAAITGQPGQTRFLALQTNGANRWWITASSEGETGSHAGSNLSILGWRDDSTYREMLGINRATGAAAFGGDLSVTGSIESKGPVSQVAFRDRVGAPGYLWFSSNGNAYLYDAAQTLTRITVDTSGMATFGAGLQVHGNTILNGPQFAYAGYHQFGHAAQTGVNLLLDSAAGTPRSLQFQTASFARWLFHVSAEPETGGNAGSNFTISRYDDAGNPLGTGFAMTRATGAAVFGGTVTISGGGDLVLDGAAGTGRDIHAKTGGLNRWTFKMADEGAETGSNAGSNFALYRFDDTGALLGSSVFGVIRSTGTATFNYAVWFGGQTTFFNTANFAANVLPDSTNTRSLGNSALHWVSMYASTVYASGDGSATALATTGAVRLKNAQNIGWRNAANNANLTLGVTAGNVLAASGAMSVAGKSVAVSASAGNALTWNADGFYSAAVTQAQYDALLARVVALEAQMGAGANGHYHLMGTWQQTQKATLPTTVLEEAPAA